MRALGASAAMADVASGLRWIFTRLAESDAEATGAWSFGHDGGARSVVLLERGRVCWAAAPRRRHRLTDLVAARVGCARERIDAIVQSCRREGEPIGEALVRHGLLTAERFLDVLLRDTCESLAHMAADVSRAPPVFTRHKGGTYQAQLTVSLAEAITHTSRLLTGQEGVAAQAELALLTSGGGRAAAFARHGSALLPVAIAGDEDLPLTELLSVGAWSEGALDAVHRFEPARRVVSSTSAAGAVAAFELDGLSCGAVFARDVELSRFLSFLNRKRAQR